MIFAGDLKGYGQAVIVDHGDGFSTVYGYASQLLVANNAEVAAGASRSIRWVTSAGSKPRAARTAGRYGFTMKYPMFVLFAV